ncbi:MAG TPA: hypothetical protein VML96_05055 [Egibacteraceae bacterium]|nr:hypothetical protein [Egibacteraceae bacterium]
MKFATAEGKEGQHTAVSLDEALSFVERLRNTEEVADARVFRMQEVPIEFRAYYKVELKASEATAPAAEITESPVPAPPVVEVDAPAGVQAPIVISAEAPAKPQTVDVQAPAEMSKRLFSRS